MAEARTPKILLEKYIKQTDMIHASRQPKTAETICKDPVTTIIPLLIADFAPRTSFPNLIESFNDPSKNKMDSCPIFMEDSGCWSSINSYLAVLQSRKLPPISLQALIQEHSNEDDEVVRDLSPAISTSVKHTASKHPTAGRETSLFTSNCN